MFAVTGNCLQFLCLCSRCTFIVSELIRFQNNKNAVALFCFFILFLFKFNVFRDPFEFTKEETTEQLLCGNCVKVFVVFFCFWADWSDQLANDKTVRCEAEWECRIFTTANERKRSKGREYELCTILCCFGVLFSLSLSSFHFNSIVSMDCENSMKFLFSLNCPNYSFFIVTKTRSKQNKSKQKQRKFKRNKIFVFCRNQKS